jgi:GntR family transcriptional regulator
MEHKRQRVQFGWVCLKARKKGPDVWVLMSYTEQMSSRSLTAASKVLFAKVLDNENDYSARLSLSPATSVIKIERLRHAAGEPFALETCYLSAPEFPGLLDAPSAGNLFSEFSNAITRSSSAMRTRRSTLTAADPRIAEILSIPPARSLLRIRQVIYSTKGQAIMYVLGFYRSDQHNLVIRRFR